MKYWIFLIILSSYFESFSQTSIHISSGLGTNSGALAKPYDNRSPTLVLPWLVQMDMKHFISKKEAISLLFQRKRNLKGGGFLDGPSAKSISFYSGLAYSHRFVVSSSSGTMADIGCGLLYGNERLNWEDEYWSLFSGSGLSGRGEDTFQLLQLAPFLDVNWQKKRVVFNVRIQIAYDFILSSERVISFGDAIDYQDKGSGMISASYTIGMGVIINSGQ